MTNLFFISSPLHFLTTCSFAIQHQEQVNVLVVMSKNDLIANQLIEATSAFPELFNKVINLTAITSKQAKLATINKLLAEISVDNIFTGNDRRYEFQYAIATAKQNQPSCKGIYLDDGAVSYTGHKSMNNFAHNYIDPWLKKLVYGLWYQQAKTIGASNWIDTAYLFFPELAHPLLQSKQLIALSAEQLAGIEFNKINQVLVNNSPNIESINFANIKAVICLPHEAVYLANNDYFDLIHQLLADNFSQEQIAIKAHPRSNNSEIIRQAFGKAQLLPNTLAMESLLIKLNDDTTVIGDISTSLLTAKWLKPSLEVKAICQHQQSPLIPLFEQLNIQLLAGSD